MNDNDVTRDSAEAARQEELERLRAVARHPAGKRKRPGKDRRAA